MNLPTMVMKGTSSKPAAIPATFATDAALELPKVARVARVAVANLQTKGTSAPPMSTVVQKLILAAGIPDAGTKMIQGNTQGWLAELPVPAAEIQVIVDSTPIRFLSEDEEPTDKRKPGGNPPLLVSRTSNELTSVELESTKNWTSVVVIRTNLAGIADSPQPEFMEVVS